MDIYGHVNNVQYYSYFDTAIAQHWIEVVNSNQIQLRLLGLWSKRAAHLENQ